ncbi:hypothetical protein HQ585_08095 [candidate division KSB1 bacterium]|nr:hypothetical protein [candidate division KSB1 bacterium]
MSYATQWCHLDPALAGERSQHLMIGRFLVALLLEMTDIAIHDQTSIPLGRDDVPQAQRTRFVGANQFRIDSAEGGG